MRYYLGEADLQPLTDLFNAAETVDHLGQGETVASLRDWLSDPTLDVDHDFRVWEDADHRLIGVADLFSTTVSPEEVAVWLRFRVHPQAWSGELTMTRPLTSPISPRQPPGEVILRPVHDADEITNWVVLVNDANRDIHNPYPVTIDGRRQELRQAEYVSALDLVAVAPDGTFAAFCWCSIADQHVGWVRRLGVRLHYPKHGLGRFLLLTGLQQLQVHGAKVANLQVDAGNTPARGLYTALGFQTTDNLKHYTKYVRDGKDAE